MPRVKCERERALYAPCVPSWPANVSPGGSVVGWRDKILNGPQVRALIVSRAFARNACAGGGVRRRESLSARPDAHVGAKTVGRLGSTSLDCAHRPFSPGVWDVDVVGLAAHLEARRKAASPSVGSP